MKKTIKPIWGNTRHINFWFTEEVVFPIKNIMKVIIIGSTGMVGQSVLFECLEHNKIDHILAVSRTPLNVKHPKLKEVIHEDFLNWQPIKGQFKDYDACFHCMGVSVVGLSEKEYYKITYSMSEALANALYEANPNMVVIYVSGKGTDSSERGKFMWARIKGKTENMFFSKGFKKFYAFRPGVILPQKGIKSKTGLYNVFYFLTRPLFPLFAMSKHVTTTTKLGLAMINTVLHLQDLNYLENKDINQLAEK